MSTAMFPIGVHAFSRFPTRPISAGWVLLLWCAFIPAGTTVRGEEWFQFRGPDGQGHSSVAGLPLEWSATKNVAWRAAIPGEGWSSPVVSSGRIYLTTAVPATNDMPIKYSLRAMCLDGTTGRILWDTEVLRETEAFSPRIHSKNSHASPTPIIAGDQLFVHFGHEGTACLDINGKILWTNDSLRYAPVHGNGGSPTLEKHHLIFSCDGASDPFVVALDRWNGKVVWRTSRETDAVKKFSFSTPLVIDVGGTRQVISPGSNAVCAYDPDSGVELWRVRYDGYSVIPRPVYGHGLLFLSTGYDRPTVLAIRPDGRGDVTDTHVAWSLQRGAPHTPSLLLHGDELYMISDRGVATCCQARTGEIQWQERLNGNFSASPLCADHRIYFQSEEGTGYVIEASRYFRLLATNVLGERSLASYAVIDRALLIRTAHHLYRIESSEQ